MALQLLTTHHLSAHCSLLTAHCSLLTAHRSLLTAHCSLLTAHCSLLTAHCSLLTTHCALPTTHYATRNTQHATRNTQHTHYAPRHTQHTHHATGFAIAPEDLVKLAKNFLASRGGFGADPELLSPAFQFIAPVVGPLGKAEFVKAIGSVDIATGFPDFQVRVSVSVRG